jgi:hypothetical protein
MNDEAVAELGALGKQVHVATFQQAGARGEYEVNRQIAKWTIDSKAVDEIHNVICAQWNPSAQPSAFAPTRKLIEEYAPRATDDLSRRFFQHAERVTEQLERRASGEWVDLRFDADMLGWEGFADRWTVDADTILCLWAHEGGARCESPDWDFRPAVEIELELSPGTPPIRGPLVCIGSATCGPWKNGLRQPLFGIEPRFEITDSGPTRRDYAVLPGTAKRVEYAPLPTTGPHKLHLRRWSNLYEFEVDGYRWTRRLPESMKPENIMGIGEAYPMHAENGGPVAGGGFKLSNVRLRNVVGDPPEVK